MTEVIGGKAVLWEDCRTCKGRGIFQESYKQRKFGIWRVFNKYKCPRCRNFYSIADTVCEKPSKKQREVV